MVFRARALIGRWEMAIVAQKRWADGQEPLLDGDAGIARTWQASESRFLERGWPN
jgi:hypothetical protein